MAEAPRWSRWPARVRPHHVAIAIVIASAVFLGYVLALFPPGGGPVQTVQDGDTVTVHYIGFFESGRVFDTSRRAVALDNASYPKAVSFEFRRTYNPLSFAVGGGTSTVIAGMEEGVRGMRVGEVRLLEIPPSLGYGPSDLTLREDRPLREEFPQFETLSRAEFEVRFATDPALGLVVAEPFWGWNVTVTGVAGSFVTIMHLPGPGDLLRPYGAWQARVELVDSGANGGKGLIVVRHLLDGGDVDAIQAEDEAGTFRIVAVTPLAGTYTVDYNREVVGQTLFFEVELLEISRS